MIKGWFVLLIGIASTITVAACNSSNERLAGAPPKMLGARPAGSLQAATKGPISRQPKEALFGSQALPTSETQKSNYGVPRPIGLADAREFALSQRGNPMLVSNRMATLGEVRHLFPGLPPEGSAGPSGPQRNDQPVILAEVDEVDHRVGLPDGTIRVYRHYRVVLDQQTGLAIGEYWTR